MCCPDAYVAFREHVLKHGLAWVSTQEEGEDAAITDPAVWRGLAEVKTRLLVLDSLGRHCVRFRGPSTLGQARYSAA